MVKVQEDRMNQWTNKGS